jgi:transcriptional regulator with XRE-family HTH domain
VNSLTRPESHLVSSYLAILQALLREKDISHADAAKALGWDSPSTVGNKLRGERRMQLTELEAMAKLLGITLVQLAAQSDDLRLTEFEETARAAALFEGWPEEKRRAALAVLEAMDAATPRSQD